MQHHFDIEVAQKYGILEAIILNNLVFWIEHNKANDNNFYDGYYWTYNSTKAFSDLMPYASQRQIQKALTHLKDEGIIQTGNYNKSAYDRTLWYALTEKGNALVQKRKSILPTGEMEETNQENGFNREVQPIPDINTNQNKTNKKPSKKQIYIDDEQLNEAFLDFLEMRKKMKKPMTERAIELAIKKLLELSQDAFGVMDNDKALEIINQAIERGWLTFYPLKEQKAVKQSQNGSIDWDNV